jgi:hypothetical protein
MDATAKTSYEVFDRIAPLGAGIGMTKRIRGGAWPPKRRGDADQQG